LFRAPPNSDAAAEPPAGKKGKQKPTANRPEGVAGCRSKGHKQDQKSKRAKLALSPPLLKHGSVFFRRGSEEGGGRAFFVCGFRRGFRHAKKKAKSEKQHCLTATIATKKRDPRRLDSRLWTRHSTRCLLLLSKPVSSSASVPQQPPARQQAS